VEHSWNKRQLAHQPAQGGKQSYDCCWWQ
jgi:hypothetical protein